MALVRVDALAYKRSSIPFSLHLKLRVELDFCSFPIADYDGAVLTYPTHILQYH